MKLIVALGELGSFTCWPLGPLPHPQQSKGLTPAKGIILATLGLQNSMHSTCIYSRVHNYLGSASLPCRCNTRQATFKLFR